MARDRRRAKQRRERSAAAAARGGKAAGAVRQTEPGRADVPGALDHASSDVDEFDAALVRGAGGVAAEPGAAEREELEDEQSRAAEIERDNGAGTEDALQEGGGSGGRDIVRGRGGGGGGGDADRPSGAPLREGNRAIGFLRASWAELQRVQWPDRRQVTQATAVVLGFVAIAGAYLGLADFVAKEIVEFIL
ncbi:MAG TPA: preprotein translocase subunit SecE [Solirubrobacteraceae bacterium]|nr:preprotein translocase subunit SecE [Solirubrobacteraceae bacterium]